MTTGSDRSDWTAESNRPVHWSSCVSFAWLVWSPSTTYRHSLRIWIWIWAHRRWNWLVGLSRWEWWTRIWNWPLRWGRALPLPVPRSPASEPMWWTAGQRIGIDLTKIIINEFLVQMNLELSQRCARYVDPSGGQGGSIFHDTMQKISFLRIEGDEYIISLDPPPSTPSLRPLL